METKIIYIYGRYRQPRGAGRRRAMNRQLLYWIVSLTIYFLSAYLIWKYFVHEFLGGIICALPFVFIGNLLGEVLDEYISSRYPGFLYTPYDEKRVLAEARMKKRKELQEKMLVEMQYMQGLERTIAELNAIFKANRELKLTRWVVFRSWYKDQIDHMLQYPDIYHLSVEGEAYSKDADPLYDPKAPDWSIYDREHYYDDEDDEDDGDDDDFEDFGDDHKKSKVSDALAIGMGIGIVNTLTGDYVDDGESGAD